METTSAPTIDASTAPAIDTSTSTQVIDNSPAATPLDTASTTEVASSTSAAETANTLTFSSPIEPAPKGLNEIHIIGTKYTDYFADGTTVASFPGDPQIDGNLDKPNAPIPTRGGLTWDHTAGGYLYDTPSGDLEVGDYALQPNGTYIQNAPPFVSSTSTPATLIASTTNDGATETSASSSSVASPAVSTSTVTTTSDNATTSSEATTSLTI